MLEKEIIDSAGWGFVSYLDTLVSAMFAEPQSRNHRSVDDL